MLNQLCIQQMKSEVENTQTNIGPWKVEQKIGEGSFGCIYQASKMQKNKDGVKEKVAIKTELITNIKQMLLLEYRIYKEFEGIKGFPKVFQYVQEERFSYLVMEKFEVSLDKHAATKFPKQFVPANTLLQIMHQTLKIVEQIHRKGYLYRDLKPANFMVKSPYQEIFIIDFGLCKKYIVNDRHISLKTNKKLVGTPIFCSSNTHSGLEQSRRDDLQSWVWTCLYFCLQLPWENVLNKKQLTRDQQCQEIHKIKRSVKWEEYLKEINRSSKNCIPSCILKIIQHIRNLQFEQQPHYNFIYKLLTDDYSLMFKTKLNPNQIVWESKIPLSQNVVIGQVINNNEETESPRKARKINFKAPIKQKVNHLPQSMNSNTGDNGDNKIKFTFSN